MLKEKLADLCHNQWSGWMKYLFSKSTFNEDGSVTIPKELVSRWQRQLYTDYINLSDSEKESDLKEADKFIKLLNNDNFTYEAKMYYDNGRRHIIEANTLDVLKFKCSVYLDHERINTIEINRVQTVGYLKCPLLKDEDLLK